MQPILAILPYAVGSAISPLILTASIFAVSEKNNPLVKALAYLAGATLSIIIIGSVIILLNIGAKKVANHPSFVDIAFKMIAGFALVVFAIFQITKKKSHQASQVKKGLSVGKYFILGVGLMAVNTSSIILYFPASVILTHESVSFAQKLESLAVMISFTVLPAAIAPLMVLLLSNRSKPVLNKLSSLVRRYGTVVIAIIFGSLGILLLIKATTELIKLT